MSDKDFTESIDDFFDVRSLAAVLIGFILTKWIEVLVLMFWGEALIAQAIIWPIIFVFLVVVLANAGRKTNHDLKHKEFRDEISKVINEIEKTQEEINDNE